MTSSLDHTLARMAQLQARIRGGTAAAATLIASAPQPHANVRRTTPPVDAANPTFATVLARQLKAQQALGGLFDSYQTPSASFDAGGLGALGNAFGWGSGLGSLLGAFGSPLASYPAGAYGGSGIGSLFGLSGFPGLLGTPYASALGAGGYRYNPFRDLEVTSPFGLRLGLGGVGEEFHSGIDYALAEGTPLPAVGSGTITEVSEDDPSGLGRSVAYRLDGGETVVYGHLSGKFPLPAYAGQRVTAGQILGYSGSSGRSTGPRLHVGIRLNGAWVDPRQYLSLLP